MNHDRHHKPQPNRQSGSSPDLEDIAESVDNHAVRPLRDWWQQATETDGSLRVRLSPVALAARFEADRGFDDPPCDAVVLQHLTQAERVPGRFDFGGGSFRQALEPELVAVIPPRFGGCFESQGDFAVQAFVLPWQQMRRDIALETGSDSADFGRWHERWHHDLSLAALIQSAWRTTLRGEPLRLFHESLIGMIGHRLAVATPSERPDDASAPSLSGRQLADATAYLHDVTAAGRTPSIATAAARLGISRYQFSRWFRVATGQSPRSYVRHVKVEIARHLIARSVPLATAAHRAGFSDQAHLGRAFRTQLGLTPAEYRSSIEK